MESKYITLWNRLISLLLLAALLFLAYAFSSPDPSARTPSLIVLSFFYLLYLISAFTSPPFRYLLHYSDIALIYDYMQKLFYTPAQLIMHIVCYHYETRQVSEGNSNTRTESVKVVSHTADSQFYYTSWRDVSGIFVVDTRGAMADNSRAFVKLRLTLELQFSEDGTIEDYEQQRASFMLHHSKDTFQDYSQVTTLEGFKEHMLVRVSDYRPKCFSAGWFAGFAVIGLAELYKLYVDRYCTEQSFSIRKVVSTRRNLAELAEYAAAVPQIRCLNDVRKYDEFPPQTIPAAPGAKTENEPLLKVAQGGG